MATQVVELQADLRQKSFELSHVRMVLSEKQGLLDQASMQLELTQEKMQVLRDRCQVLEAQGGPVGRGGGAKTLALQAYAGGDDDTRGLRDSNGPARGGMMILAGGGGGGGGGIHAEALSALRRDKAELVARVATLEAQIRVRLSGLFAGHPDLIRLISIR